MCTRKQFYVDFGLSISLTLLVWGGGVPLTKISFGNEPILGGISLPLDILPTKLDKRRFYAILKYTNKIFYHLFLLVFPAAPDSLRLDHWGTWHRCQHLNSIVEWRNLVTGEKLSKQIQVLADIIAIAASALNHCVTSP